MDNQPLEKMDPRSAKQKAKAHLRLALNDYFAIAKSAGESREQTIASIKDMLENDVA